MKTRTWILVAACLTTVAIAVCILASAWFGVTVTPRNNANLKLEVAALDGKLADTTPLMVGTNIVIETVLVLSNRVCLNFPTGVVVPVSEEELRFLRNAFPTNLFTNTVTFAQQR
jgi:hypothetical protein